MNLFRSEGHARNWSDFKSASEGGLLPLEDVMAMHAGPRHRELLGGRYISTYQDYVLEYTERTKRITDDDPYWRAT